MTDIVYTSPCKFNLYLDVLGIRLDGYHQVVTVIEPIFLSDRLLLREIHRGIKVISDHPDVPSGDKNIVYRAVELYQSKSGLNKGVSIRIEKKIPVAAGLGGGSGNAAATLMQLDRLWGPRLSREELTDLARQLGSDVPFFLDPRTSLCWGRGEKVVPLPPAPPFWVVLLNPPLPLSTSWAYAQLVEQESFDHPHLNQTLTALKKKNLGMLGRTLYNVFQDAIARRFPEVRSLLEFLQAEKAMAAVMSGSGATVVGLNPTAEEARRIAARAREVFPKDFRVAMANNFNRECDFY